MSVTLSRLLAVGFFPDPVLISPDRGLSTLVASVTSLRGPLEVAEMAPFALAVFDRSRLRAEDTGTDLAIRLAGERRAAGLLLQRPPAPLSALTQALAEESGVALILVDHDEPDQLVPAMDRFVRAPEVGDSGVLGALAQRLRSVRADPEKMVDILTRALRHPVALVDPEGRPLAGVLTAAAAYSLDSSPTQLTAAHPMSWVRPVSDDDLVVAQPVQLTAGGPANLWLVASVPGSSPARVHVASQALGIATWAFVAHLATTALGLERRAKQHEDLLTRLVEEAESPPRTVLEQATAAGWRLGGWHTGIHVTPRGVGDLSRSAVRNRLRESLRSHGVYADPVGDGDGWSLWTTAAEAPHAASEAALLRAVRATLSAVERECPSMRLCAGIGTAYEGTVGLRASLREAQQACLLASARNTAGAVERVGGDNVKRLLANRYVTSLQHALAEQLLRPLIDADVSGQLMHTLSSYFDHNASTTATASALGVHRNTVLQRLERIRVLLTVDFGDADDRLALHLAIRLVQSAPPRPRTPFDEGAVPQP